MKQYISLSISNLRRRKLRAWLTMLGIFIGIAAVVSLISLGNGLRTAVTGQFSTLSADTLTVQNAGTGFGPPGSTTIQKLNEHDLDLIKKVSGVDEAIPRLIRVVRVEYNKIAQFNYITSMPENQKEIDTIYNSFSMKAEEGRVLKEGDKRKVILGHNFLNSEGFDKKIRVGTTLNIQGKEFEVVGFLEQTSSFQVNLAILMMEKDIKDILKIGDETDIIAVKTKSTDITDQVAKDIEKVLRKDRGEKEGEEDFSVQTPLQAISSINTILNIINIVVAGIAAISLVVGGIGIMNTMYTSVLERTKDIGTMKAIGARNSDILVIFMIESGLLGLVGGIIGAALGISMAFAVSGIANSAFGGDIINVIISYPLLIGAILFSCLVGIGSGILPAIRASRLNPVEALRG